MATLFDSASVGRVWIFPCSCCFEYAINIHVYNVTQCIQSGVYFAVREVIDHNIFRDEEIWKMSFFHAQNHFLQ